MLSLFVYGVTLKPRSVPSVGFSDVGGLVFVQGKVVSESAFSSGSFLRVCMKQCVSVLAFGQNGFLGKIVFVTGVVDVNGVVVSRKIEVS